MRQEGDLPRRNTVKIKPELTMVDSSPQEKTHKPLKVQLTEKLVVEHSTISERSVFDCPEP